MSKKLEGVVQDKQRDMMEALKKIGEDIEFVIRNYYPNYSPALDEKLEDVKSAIDCELDKMKQKGAK